MAEKSRDRFWRRNNPIMWGVLATAAVIVFGIWAANQSVCQMDFWGNQSCGGSKWSVFLESAPNEIGDTLAGFAGALAFVWLIAAVWLQGQELAAQREELREQREATQDMARAQSEQVKLLQVQGAIFEDEKRQRRAAQASSLLEEASKNVVRCFYEADMETLSWWVGDSSQNTQREKFLEHGYNPSPVDETTDRVLALLAGLFGVAVRRMKRVGEENLHYKPALPAALKQLREYLELIVGCLEDLPEVQAERQREINLREAARSLSELIDGPYWDDVEAAQ